MLAEHDRKCTGKESMSVLTGEIMCKKVQEDKLILATVELQSTG